MAEAIKIQLEFTSGANNQAFTKLNKGASEAGEKSGKEFSNNFSKSVKGSLDSVRRNIIGAVGGFLAFRTVSNILSQSTRNAIEFEKAITEINTILPKNTKLTGDQTKALRELSKEYGTSSQKQAKSFYQIISAGVTDASEATKLLNQANQLAIGGLTDVNSSIDILTSIVNAYGAENISAKEAADSLFTAVRLGKTTVDELANSLSLAIPAARSAGVGLDVVNAAVATLTTNGFETSVAVTRVNGLLTALARNSSQLGEGFNIAAVQSDGLVTVLQRLQKRTGGQADALLELLGRQEAVQAVQTLARNGAQAFSDTLGQFANKTNAASKAFAQFKDTADFQFKQLTAEFDDLTLSIGERLVPALLGAVRGFKGLFLAQKGEATQLSVTNNAIKTQRERVEELNQELREMKESQQGGFSFSSIFNKATNAQIEEQSRLLQIEKDRLTGLRAEKQHLISVSQEDNSRQVEIDQLRTAQGEYDNYIAKRQEEAQQRRVQVQEILLQAAVMAQVTREQFLANASSQDIFIDATKSNFENIVSSLSATKEQAAKMAKEMSAAIFSTISRGVGSAFQNVGKALAEGGNAFQAFADGLKNVLADVASSIGDVFIKWGIANLVSGNIGMGAAQIAAGGALKIISGSLGGGGDSGGATSAPTGTFTDPVSVDSGNINEMQETRQAEERTNLSLNIEGSLVRESELNGYISEILEEGSSRNATIIPSLRTS